MPELTLPASVAWLRGRDDGRAWLDSVPALVERACARWGLVVGEPYADSLVSVVLPATRADGLSCVLKIQYPHRDCRNEAAALQVWDGVGAIRLLAHDAGDRVLLLERCEPGDHLATRPDIAIDVLIDLLPRLWRPAAAPFDRIEDEAAVWQSTVVELWESAGRPCERRLVDATADFFASLAPTQGERILVHQDLHGENVLASDRSGWLAIDPKPLLAEREFSLVPVVRSFELGPTRADLFGRLDRLTAELDVDRDRTARWTVAHGVLWSFDSVGFMAQHQQVARWLLERLEH